MKQQGNLPRRLALALSLGLMSALPVLNSHADPLTTPLNVQTAADKAEIKSQKKIDSVANQTDKIVDEYRLILRETESLRLYNNHLQKLTTSQNEEMESIQKQLTEIGTTSREVIPLMLRMIDTLKRFVELDVPFLPEERAKRVAALDELMNRADVSTAEKFRRVIEAYQVEMEYGRTIEAYRSTVKFDNQDHTVDFLRVGRVGLYYQSLDGEHSGAWNPKTRKWETLSGSARGSIRTGLRIARKQAAPDLLMLPVPAPEKIQ